jgi:hypothetical protein
MRKLTLVAAVAALFLVALPVASAGAVSPYQAVEIEVETSFYPNMPPNGPFTATGAAVDNGLICGSGWAFDTFGKFAPREGSPQGVNVQATKVFLCGAGSWLDEADHGFVIKFQIHIDYRKGSSSNWVVTGGWGDYSAIAGNGHGSGNSLPSGDEVDSLWGKVR